MDLFILVVVVAVVGGLAYIISKHKLPVVEAAAEKVAMEAFAKLQEEIKGHQAVITKAKADLAQAQAKFNSLKATVAQLVLPPEA